MIGRIDIIMGCMFSGKSTEIIRIINAVKNGIGVMPSWEGILSQEEIEAVAYYVFNSTNK